jgi:uncharacterized membrane protein YkvA (DUF1232 family)
MEERQVAMTIVLELSDDDLGYFRGIMDDTVERNAQRGEKELIENVRRLLEKTEPAAGPEYVRKRLDDLRTLLAMLEDPEWPLEDTHRKRIIAAVSYFADPQDVIPDKVPGLGFLDDALMAELVIDEVKYELEGYREFCEFRANEEALRKKTEVSRSDWLAAKRRQMFLQIERRQRERRRHGSREGPTPPILRYQY